MTPGRIACALAVMAVLCVLALFFFPGVEGPYSAVHGPVTALLSIRAAALLRLRIVKAGLSVLRGHLNSGMMALVQICRTALASLACDFDGGLKISSPVLRC